MLANIGKVIACQRRQDECEEVFYSYTEIISIHTEGTERLVYTEFILLRL